MVNFNYVRVSDTCSQCLIKYKKMHTLPLGRHSIVFVGALQKLTAIASGVAFDDELGQSGVDGFEMYVNCNNALTVSNFLHFSRA